MSHTMLDLTIVMTPYLNITSINQLYEIITNLIFKDDPILQKKSYKILKSLSETDDGKNVIIKNIEDLQIKLRDSTINTTSSSKKDRLLTLSNIIKLLPDTDLHMIPDILSEVILSTKEVNEKSRLAAYDLLIIMGNKMKNGGNIIMSKILESKESDNTSSSSSSSINANIDEFVFNMVIAGLAATTPHMISATITTLSRLLFEFKNDLNKDYIHKLIDTMNNFVNCTNREIVKSALGFVKVTTISLDLDIIKPHLNQIITGLLTWSNEHKKKFVPENDKKLLVNIKKRKELDFLDKGIISKVIGVNPSKTRKQRKDFSKAFKETRDEADDNYTESQKSNDGFTLLPIGKEYKAKNAGGDIKKKGKPDPYAYVSLSSVYKGKRHNQQKGPKVSITSKSKIQKRQGIKKRK
ncbi:20013_t:CDS:2 [Rhizophagus irregularis]|nr:20013_t:CDS:2 [Rhizophagus irregularis]